MYSCLKYFAMYSGWKRMAQKPKVCFSLQSWKKWNKNEKKYIWNEKNTKTNAKCI